MENQFALLDSIREASFILKGCQFEEPNNYDHVLAPIMDSLGLTTKDEAMVFVAVFERQCSCRPTDYENIAHYFGITPLDAMQLVPAFISLKNKGYLVLDTGLRRQEASKQYMICQNVFDAIVEGVDVGMDTWDEAGEMDQFEFCKAVSNKKENRMDGHNGTAKLFADIKRLEDKHKSLTLVSGLKSVISDIESRALFYDICTDYADQSNRDRMTDIESTLTDFYASIGAKISIKQAIISGEHPLIKAKLAHMCSRNILKLTNNGIRLLYGDHAESIIAGCKAQSRYDFVGLVHERVSMLSHNYTIQEVKGMLDDVSELENENPELTMVKNVKSILRDVDSRLIFYLIANDLIDGDTFPLRTLNIFGDRRKVLKLKRDFKEGKHPLMLHSLAELCGGGILDGAQLRLTDKGREIFLEEDLDLFDVTVNDKDLITPDKIAEKHLYFDGALQRQLSTLERSLAQDNYVSLCQRLADNNMPKGVAVLLYGLPGTGKTESVMQIARATGRTIMHVDISATKTCWFGESEKLIKEVFSRYRKLCEKCSVKPILLFNEADAVFAKRKDNTSSSVAQTENAIQNIILEEMELLDGILIATTNLADNLDKAFERRFLMKIGFDRPTVEAKKQIWMDKLHSLSPTDALTLAHRYDFSGGEIDNIARKVIIGEVINGAIPTIDTIIRLCDEEKIGKHTTRVGF